MGRKKLLTCVTALSLAAFMLAGCKNSTPAEITAGSSDKKDTSVEDTPLPEERVIASSVAVVEILDALGVPMAGVPASSYGLPEGVKDAERIGNPMSPDLEIIASLEPTIIVSVNTLSDELKNQFETLGIESFFADLSGYDGLKETIASLGERFGAQKAAQKLITELEEKEASIADKISGRESPDVLIIFGANSSFMTASEDTYVGDLVKRAGGINIIEDAPSSFTPVDMEYLAEKNPDYILFMAHANPEESLKAFKKEFETNEAWKNFDAAANDKVYALETGLFGMSANLLAAQALDKLADILYGEK